MRSLPTFLPAALWERCVALLELSPSWCTEVDRLAFVLAAGAVSGWLVLQANAERCCAADVPPIRPRNTRSLFQGACACFAEVLINFRVLG